MLSAVKCRTTPGASERQSPYAAAPTRAFSASAENATTGNAIIGNASNARGKQGNGSLMRRMSLPRRRRGLRSAGRRQRDRAETLPPHAQQLRRAEREIDDPARRVQPVGDRDDHGAAGIPERDLDPGPERQPGVG